MELKETLNFRKILTSTGSNSEKGILLIGKDGTIKEFNKTALRLLGPSPAGNINDPSYQFIAPSGLIIPSEELPWFKAINTGEEIRNFLLGSSLRGETKVWIKVKAKPLLNLSNEISGALVTFRFDKGLSEPAAGFADDFEESSLDYHTLFENLTEEVHFWKVVRGEQGEIKTWRLVYVNPPTLKSWGIQSLNEIKGKTTDEIFGPGSTDHYMPVVKEIFTTGQSHHFIDYFPNLNKHFRFTTVPLGEYFITTGSDITDIKLLQDSFEQQHAELEAVFEAVQDSIVVYDNSGGIVMFNKAFVSLSSLTPSEIKAGKYPEMQEVFDLYTIGGKLLTYLYWPASRVIKGETISEEKYKLVNKKTGNVLFLSFTGAPIKDKNGIQILAMTTIRDITEKILADAALKESAANFQALADNISPMVWVTDNLGKNLWSNKRFQEYTGLSTDEILAKGMDLHHPDYRDKAATNFLKAVEEERIFEDVFPLKGKDGNYRWFLTNAVPIRGEDGKIVKWFGTNTDITEQKELLESLDKALEELKINEAKLIDAQRLAKIGSVEVDLTRGKISWSDGMYDIFERDRNSGPPGLKEAIRYIHPEDRERIIKQLENVPGNERIVTEYRIILPGNKIKYINYFMTSFTDEKGKQTKRFGTVLDISEHKFLELKLEEALDELKERLHEKEILIRELYHRTKNNMQVISSLLNLRAVRIPDPEYRNVFIEMKERIQAMSLVHEKLYQSKNLSRLNLGVYIKELVDLLLLSHMEKSDKIEVRYNLADCETLIDTAIPCGFIITELVLNVIKYAFPGDRKGILHVELKRSKDHVELIISDNGIGLKKSEIYNEDKLGLQLVKSLAEDQLNAKIKVDVSNGVAWSIRFQEKLYNERI
jgi:PAS domain S-box-containing protein